MKKEKETTDKKPNLAQSEKSDDVWNAMADTLSNDKEFLASVGAETGSNEVKDVLKKATYKKKKPQQKQGNNALMQTEEEEEDDDDEDGGDSGQPVQ